MMMREGRAGVRVSPRRASPKCHFVLTSLHHACHSSPVERIVFPLIVCISFSSLLSLPGNKSGVVVELHEPTQPVYNEFSDNAIFATYVVAGMSVLSLATLVGVRIVKTLIKQGRCIDVMAGCAGGFRRGGARKPVDPAMMAEDDDNDGIVTDYVQA